MSLQRTELAENHNNSEGDGKPVKVEDGANSSQLG